MVISLVGGQDISCWCCQGLEFRGTASGGFSASSTGCFIHGPWNTSENMMVFWGQKKIISGGKPKIMTCHLWKPLFVKCPGFSNQCPSYLPCPPTLRNPRTGSCFKRFSLPRWTSTCWSGIEFFLVSRTCGVWLIDWLIDCLFVCLLVCLFVWLIDWLIDEAFDSSSGVTDMALGPTQPGTQSRPWRGDRPSDHREKEWSSQRLSCNRLTEDFNRFERRISKYHEISNIIIFI